MRIEDLKDERDREACRRAQVTKHYDKQPDGRPTNLRTRDGQMPRRLGNRCSTCLEYTAQDHGQPCGNPQQTFDSVAREIVSYDYASKGLVPPPLREDVRCPLLPAVQELETATAAKRSAFARKPLIEREADYALRPSQLTGADRKDRR